MGRAQAGDGGHWTVAPEDRPSLVWQRLLQDAAEDLHADEAVRHDVLHDQADFVHVGRDHDPRPRGASRQRGQHRAEPVVLDRGAKRRCIPRRRFCGLLLRTPTAPGASERLFSSRAVSSSAAEAGAAGRLCAAAVEPAASAAAPKVAKKPRRVGGMCGVIEDASAHRLLPSPRPVFTRSGADGPARLAITSPPTCGRRPWCS